MAESTIQILRIGNYLMGDEAIANLYVGLSRHVEEKLLLLKRLILAEVEEFFTGRSS